MRIEVIVDGKSHGRHEFICQPNPTEIIVVDGGEFQAHELRHDLTQNRLQVWCSKRTPTTTDKPLNRGQKSQSQSAE